MFKKMLSWIRAQLRQIFGDTVPLDDVAVSTAMENALKLWVEIYENGGPWCGGKTGLHSLDIGAGVAREFSRLVLLELNMEVTGSPRADYLSRQLILFLERLPGAVEAACAMGGMVFKPYRSGDHLVIECIHADGVVPTSFDTDGNLSGAIFPQQISRGGKIYTRLERHEFDSAHRQELVENKAFVSSTSQQLGSEIPLTEVTEWADLLPSAYYKDIDRPMFAYFRIPTANREDRHSPLGVSVFAPAVYTIQAADEQFGRLIWEYQGGEMAVYVDDTALRRDEDGNLHVDQRDRRLYRTLSPSISSSQNLYEVFAPALRDESYRKGLDSILKRIEFQCGLAYGTISDPQSVEKTAEEVRMSKQRSYATVRSIQTALQKSLEHLVYILDAYATIYQMAPAGNYEATFDWDDSLVNDPDDRRTRFWGYVQAGKFPMKQYLMEYEHYTEADAEAAVAAARSENGGDEMLSFGGA